MLGVLDGELIDDTGESVRRDARARRVDADAEGSKDVCAVSQQTCSIEADDQEGYIEALWVKGGWKHWNGRRWGCD